MKYLLLFLIVLFYSISSQSAEGDIYFCSVKKAFTIQTPGDRYGTQENFSFMFEWKNGEVIFRSGGDEFMLKRIKIINELEESFVAFSPDSLPAGVLVTFYNGDLYMAQSFLGGVGFSYGAKCTKD